jgi:hypothetical protein
MVELQLPKLITWVRFPSPAPHSEHFHSPYDIAVKKLKQHGFENVYSLSGFTRARDLMASFTLQQHINRHPMIHMIAIPLWDRRFRGDLQTIPLIPGFD